MTDETKVVDAPKDEVLSEFIVRVKLHTDDARNVLSHPEAIRNAVAQGLENYEQRRLEEEIDFTIDSTRVHRLP